MGVLGIILLIAGAILAWVQHTQKQRSGNLQLARAVKAGELQTLANAVAEEIGGGDWRDYVKLWGTVQSDDPLISELKQTPCVLYTYQVIREYEETLREKDAQGQWQTRTQRGSEVISRHEQRAPFWLEDASGRVAVNPDGAEIETVESVDDFQPGDPVGGLLSYGQFSRTLSGPSNRTAGHSDRKTLGYRYLETVLPVGQTVSVLGMATDHTGTVILAKPLAGSQRFIIALKTHEAMTHEAKRNAQRAFWAMIFCFGLGGILVLLALLG